MSKLSIIYKKSYSSYERKIQFFSPTQIFPLAGCLHYYDYIILRKYTVGQ